MARCRKRLHNIIFEFDKGGLSECGLIRSLKGVTEITWECDLPPKESRNQTAGNEPLLSPGRNRFSMGWHRFLFLSCTEKEVRRPEFRGAQSCGSGWKPMKQGRVSVITRECDFDHTSHFRNLPK